eukprot:3116704-Lingulodinium_polyedra.AAC.1
MPGAAAPLGRRRPRRSHAWSRRGRSGRPVGLARSFAVEPLVGHCVEGRRSRRRVVSQGRA